MPYSDPEINREYRRQYYANYRKTERGREYALKYRDRRKDLNAKNYELYKDVILDQCKKRRIESAQLIQLEKLTTKREVFAHYGTTCCHCDETRLSALTLDHVGQDGAERRKCGEPHGMALYRRLRKTNYPGGYRVLCFNCNILAWQSTRILSQKPAAVAARRCQIELKESVMAMFGGKCVECFRVDLRILTIHHINGDGNIERKTANIRNGQQFYRYLLRTGITDNLECRCYSCNTGLECLG